MATAQHCTTTTAGHDEQHLVPGLNGMPHRLAATLVTVFVLFSPYLANLSRDYTRYCYFWRWSDALYVSASLLTVAGVLGLLGEILRWTGRPLPIRLFDHLLLATMGVGLLGNLVFMLSKIPGMAWKPGGIQVQTAWILLALLVGFSFGRPQPKLVHRHRQACLILLPCVPLTLGMLLFNSGYPGSLESISPRPIPCSIAPVAADRERGGIYLVLFDEWSYERTFNDRAVLPRFPHLAAFAGQATVYHQAYSPGESTEYSIPGILFQTDDPAVVDYGRFGFERAGRFTPSSKHQSIFSRLAPRGYTSVVIGTSIPHRLWLGDQVDVCRTYCPYPRGYDLASHLGIHLFNAMHYSPDLWSLGAYKRLEKNVLYWATRDLLLGAHDDLDEVIRAWPAKTFVFAHILLPHSPALLNPDLSCRAPEQTGWSDGDLRQYESNLKAMDAMMARLVDELQNAGKFENSVVVLTSDHSWRSDPDWDAGRLTGPRTHVPLIVKSPGQTQAASVDTRFDTKDLGALVESLVSETGIRQSVVMENRRP